MKRFLFLFLLTSRAAMSQTVDSAQVTGFPPKSNFKFGIITELGFMLPYTSTPNMQVFFRQNNIERERPIDPFVHANVGGRYHRLKGLFQIGYGFNFVPPNEQGALVARRTYASYTGALLGYDVLNSRNQRLYLNVGLGGLFYDYAVYNRTSQPVAFQNLTQYSQTGNIPSLKLNNTYWDINLELCQREKRKHDISRVLRLGYRRGVQARAWESEAFQLIGAPTDRISQFYFQGSFYFSTNYSNAAQ
ncbi:hypothetical protein [Hymenobacter ruricola]|uniref:DUF6089 domain-containing protein n=1 Tax=Hymenobacter ruricola TaxID=2791023 RepID=A0ABS0HZG9_9BACT|nr:hypothetical protein [Hymenobacter ruricola]MBF9219704.1 hypothetical protein [Hymenobacter ruricola]